MGVKIKNIDIDKYVEGQDYVVGTDKISGVTHNYTIDDIAAYVGSGTSSNINTKILTVTEVVPGDFLTQINASTVPLVVNTGDWVAIEVLDSTGNFKELYHLIKVNTSVQIKYGHGELQMQQQDLLLIRRISDDGETNTISSVGGTS